ncbi:MAG TPA: hypothetical protein VHX64_16845, partial [Caulobacteraceae bacterium]|nr:hypothetical protein [Caulobacteraceae bacterium]
MSLVRPPVAKRFKHPIGPQVHAVLWNEWDPIAVNDFAPDDEYDRYVWPVIGKIMQGETAEQIADYLDWASNVHMECPQPRARNLEIAQKLVALATTAANHMIEPEVIVRVVGEAGRLTLNRPRALNALNAGMCET